MCNDLLIYKIDFISDSTRIYQTFLFGFKNKTNKLVDKISF